MEGLLDPAKSKMNRAKHGISLKRAEDFDFSSAFMTWTIPRTMVRSGTTPLGG